MATEKTIAEITMKEVNSKFKATIEAQSRELLDIDMRIEKLKLSLWDLEENHHYQVYLVLKEIFKLRCMQNKAYTRKLLASERNIPYNQDQIRYFFMFDYMSDNTRVMIESGRLKASTYLCVIRRDLKYREADIQDKIISKVISHEITMDDIANGTTYTILRKVNAIKPMHDTDKLALRTVYSITTLNKHLLKNFGSVLDSNYTKKFISNLSKLEETILKIKTAISLKEEESK